MFEAEAVTTRWLVSVPVWGERYVEEFCAVALPALTRAVDALRAAPGREGLDVRLVVHTDQAERVRAATSVPVDSRPVPAGARDFDCMSQAHREALSLGLLGDVAVLMTAGAVISERGLLYCAGVLDNPQKFLVLCAVPRVLAEGALPDTADARSLMEWAWVNRHPMTVECTWPHGRSRDLSRTFFVGPLGSLVTRQALPHPLAVRIDRRPLRFTPTVDANLIHCFDPTEMHVATMSDELAVLKLSPADKGFDLAGATMAERAARGELVISDPYQRWCLSHRIHLLARGPAAVGVDDDHFMAAIK